MNPSATDLTWDQTTTHLNHDGKNGDVESHQHDTVKDEDESCKLAKLLQSRDSTHGPEDQDSNLDRKVPDDGDSRLGDGGEDDVTTRNGRGEPRSEP